MKTIDTDTMRAGLVSTFSPRRIASELIHWSPFEWGLMVVLIAAQAIAFLTTGDYSVMGWIGLITGVSTILCLVLVNKGRITNYFWGFLSSGAWLVVSIHNWLIGDIFSQSFYVIMQIVGIYAWAASIRKQNENGDGSASTVESRKITPLLGTLACIGTLVICATWSASQSGQTVTRSGLTARCFHLVSPDRCL
jgi:nicotinamide mononucleotide transporter